MRITSCGMTDVGLKRGHNEDNYLINEELNLFVVADGMGGHAGGEYASAIAVNTVEEIVTSLEVDGMVTAETETEDAPEAATASQQPTPSEPPAPPKSLAPIRGARAPSAAALPPIGSAPGHAPATN